MDLTKKVFIRDGNRREYGPYEASQLASYQFEAGAVAHFEGEEQLYPLQEIVDAFDSQPASETQRQRLRKNGVIFDEATITRKIARDLYRMTPRRKAAQDARDQARENERQSRLFAMRQLGWKLPDDTPLAEMDNLEDQAPSDAETVAKIGNLLGKLSAEGLTISTESWSTRLKRQLTTDESNQLADVLIAMVSHYSHATLAASYAEFRGRGWLSRVPSSSELLAVRQSIVSKLLAGTMDETHGGLCRVLSDECPTIRFSIYGDIKNAPAATDSVIPLQIWNSDRDGYYNVTITKDLGQTMFFCSCAAGKNRKLCRHARNVLAGDAGALWDPSQRDLLVRARNWLQTASVTPDSGDPSSAHSASGPSS